MVSTVNRFTFSLLRKLGLVAPLRRRLLRGGLVGLFTTAPTLVSAASLEELEFRLENMDLQRLAEVQVGQPQPLYAFTSDGCSGGLSDGWKYVATLLPKFADKFGDQPPWEACCVSHDRAYWQGTAKDGYRLRKQADLELKQCVNGHGQADAEKLSRELELSPDDIRDAYAAAAELMYHAVRLGGRPCTVFAWRWGYGWPPCRLPFQPAQRDATEE